MIEEVMARGEIFISPLFVYPSEAKGEEELNSSSPWQV